MRLARVYIREAVSSLQISRVNIDESLFSLEILQIKFRKAHKDTKKQIVQFNVSDITSLSEVAAENIREVVKRREHLSLTFINVTRDLTNERDEIVSKIELCTELEVDLKILKKTLETFEIDRIAINKVKNEINCDMSKIKAFERSFLSAMMRTNENDIAQRRFSSYYDTL